ncbi:uncharacterized protein LOC144332228 [Macaca mulatta]
MGRRGPFCTPSSCEAAFPTADIECGGHPGGGDGTLLFPGPQPQVRLATGDHRDLAWCRAAAGSVKGSEALLTPWQLLIRPLPCTCTSCGCGSQDETGSACDVNQLTSS